jgi:hypothetical protein
MRNIEIAVDGGGGDEGRWHNGRQDGRASTAGQGDGGSLASSRDVNQRDNGNSTYYRNS